VSYIDFPIETDPEVLTADALDQLMSAISGWVPQEGHLEVWVLEVISRINAETRDVASRVPVSIFRYFGKSLLGLSPIDAARARVDTTWTVVDNAGYTIPAGTVVAYPVSGDQQVYFEVAADVVIEAGSDTSATGEVELVALEAGTEANGLAAGSSWQLVDAFAFVDTITSAASTSGGVDAETDAEYLDRLRTELQLLSPRPILPNDFAVLAQRIAGVERATAIDGYIPAVNEKQTVTITGSPTGGTFTLTYSGQTTAAIAYNANAAAVQSALVALSNIGVGDVTVTGGALPGTAVVVEFTGALAGTNVSQMTASSSLTGGSSPAVTVTTTQGGAAAQTNQERAVTVAVADEDGQAVSSGTKTAVDDYLQSLREVNFDVHVIDPTYTAVNITATLKAKAGADPTAVDTAATTAVQEYLSPATWNWSSTVRYNELISLLDQVEGVDYVVSITTPSADVTLSGVASLPTPGTVSITVDPA
jgi:Baseplate J-like protein